MKQRLEKVLRYYQKKRILNSTLKRSAVLIPLFCHQGEYYLVFTERSHDVDFHKGQVCFPGGTWEPSDSGLVQTALREAEEEIGLKAEHVEILGELDDITTLTSNYVISPFIAMIPYPYSFKANGKEIREIFAVPLSFLMEEANFRQDSYSYVYEGHVIWGATARILRQFINLLRTESEAQQ